MLYTAKVYNGFDRAFSLSSYSRVCCPRLTVGVRVSIRVRGRARVRVRARVSQR